MSDVLLYQTNDDGEINVNDGVIELTGSFETAVYLSLFGGNEDGSSYWGDLFENQQARYSVSETQHLLRSIPATSGNLLRIKDAVDRDLQWMIDEKITSHIDIDITIPRLNFIKIMVSIQAYGKESNFEFVENWKSTI